MICSKERITIGENMTFKAIEKGALKLKPLDRIHLIEHIIDSLRKPDPKIEKAWIKESEKRYTAYKNGRIKGISLQEFKKT